MSDWTKDIERFIRQLVEVEKAGIPSYQRNQLLRMRKKLKDYLTYRGTVESDKNKYIRELQAKNAALVARAARFEEAAHMAILRNPYCDRLEEVLNETESESLAHIQGEAVKNFVADSIEFGQLGGGDLNWFKQWANEWLAEKSKDHD